MTGGIHARWRDRLAGVIEATVEVLARWAPMPSGTQTLQELGVDELERLGNRYRPTVWSSTSDGRPALDLRATMRAALRAVGVSLEDRSVCTR